MAKHSVLVRWEDNPHPHKWSVSMQYDEFTLFLANAGPLAEKAFSKGSLFSPFLFGKFFDPSDAFPLWEFDSTLLRRTGAARVDWFQTREDYVLKAEIPGGREKKQVQIWVEGGKVVEISGLWRHNLDGGVGISSGGGSSSKGKDWRSHKWWEHGYVRRLEIPRDADYRNVNVTVNEDSIIELIISKGGRDEVVSVV